MKISKRKLGIIMATRSINSMELSNKACVSNSTILRACSRGGTKPSTIGKIAKALNVDVTEILEEEK